MNDKRYIFLVVLHDRHADLEYTAFEDSAEAVAFAKQQVWEFYDDFVESETNFVEYGDPSYVGPQFSGDYFYFAEWSQEGDDTCTVLRVPIK